MFFEPADPGRGASPQRLRIKAGGVFRRHVREGVLLSPFTPPVQVPFPLDVSFMTALARNERRRSEGSDWVFEPVLLSMLLDALRSTSNRFHVTLGVTAAWRLRQLDQRVVHDVTPLTAATLFFTLSSDDGLWLARGTATAGWSFTAPSPALVFKARGGGVAAALQQVSAVRR